MGDTSDGLQKSLDLSLNFSVDGAQSLQLQEYIKRNENKKLKPSERENSEQRHFNCTPCNRSFD